MRKTSSASRTETSRFPLLHISHALVLRIRSRSRRQRCSFTPPPRPSSRRRARSFPGRASAAFLAHWRPAGVRDHPVSPDPSSIAPFLGFFASERNTRMSSRLIWSGYLRHANLPGASSCALTATSSVSTGRWSPPRRKTASVTTSNWDVGFVKGFLSTFLIAFANVVVWECRTSLRPYHHLLRGGGQEHRSFPEACAKAGGTSAYRPGCVTSSSCQPAAQWSA